MSELLSTVFTFSYKVLSVGTPMLNYLPQYFLMEKQRSSGSFAIQLCYLLMTSSILRIIFWFHEQFEVCLLLQSVVVFSLQILLLYKYIDVSRNTGHNFEASESDRPISLKETPSVTPQLIRIMVPLLVSYGTFFAIFIWSGNYYIAQATGALACLLEVILPLPQVMRNWQLRSVKGLR